MVSSKLQGREVLVVQTGTANTASVLAGLERVGASARLTEDAREVREAPALVLPGVGAFGAAVESLKGRNLFDALQTRLTEGRSSLCVCLGLQLLATESEESPGVRGFGVFNQTIRRFDDASVRTPQIGWNQIEPEADCRFLTRGHAYFANSFRLREKPAGWAAAISHHGERFVAALERGNVLACQFHPELSSEWGRALIERWLVAAFTEGD